MRVHEPARPWWLLPLGRLQSCCGGPLLAVGLIWIDHAAGPLSQFPRSLRDSCPVWRPGIQGAGPRWHWRPFVPVAHLLFLTEFWTPAATLDQRIAATVVRGAVIFVMALWIARLSEHERALTRLRAENWKGCCRFVAFCKSIRNTDDQWEPLETFISTRSDAEFSHGFCPTWRPRPTTSISSADVVGLSDQHIARAVARSHPLGRRLDRRLGRLARIRPAAAFQPADRAHGHVVVAHDLTGEAHAGEAALLQARLLGSSSSAAARRSMNSTRQVVQRALPPHACRMSTCASCSMASTRRLPDSTSTGVKPSTRQRWHRAAMLTYRFDHGRRSPDIPSAPFAAVEDNSTPSRSGQAARRASGATRTPPTSRRRRSG